MILLIDNYDSFSYNLYQLVGSLGENIEVIRNDAKTCDEILKMNPTAIILSPGPGRPSEAGICEEVVRTLGDKIPMLGVCLGHQAICEAYGAKIVHAKHLMHGKQSEAALDNSSVLFQNMPAKIKVARYHSLSVDAKTLPKELAVTAMADDGEVMAVEHRTAPVFGVQFHPESIMTPDGRQIMINFLTYAYGRHRES